MTDDTIIIKIRKLLALAENNGSEAEAASAMSKVQELLQQHNLDIDAVRGKEEVTFTREHKEYEWNASWIREVYHGLAQLYFCQFYYTPNGTVNQRIYLIGEPVNVQTCQCVADMVINTGKKLAKQYATMTREEHGGTVGEAISASNGFKKGFGGRVYVRALALKRAVQKQMQPNETGTALIVADLYKRTEAAIALYTKDTLKLKFKNGAGMRDGDANHMASGAAAANNVNLRASSAIQGKNSMLLGRG